VFAKTEGNHQVFRLIAQDIVLRTQSFMKNFFFEEESPVRFFFWENFKSLIFPAIPDRVPAFEGGLTKTQLMKPMCDSQILEELGRPVAFTPAEFAAAICGLFQKQLKSGGNMLFSKSHANIFYVQLLNGECVIPVCVDRYADYLGWSLLVSDFDEAPWSDGHCVFFRS